MSILRQLPEMFTAVDVLRLEPTVHSIPQAMFALCNAESRGYVDWVGMSAEGLPVYSLTQKMKAKLS